MLKYTLEFKLFENECMLYRLKILLISCVLMWGVWADPSTGRNESAVLSEYTGLEGTAPKKETISNAGSALEFLPNGTNIFGFFSQTTATDVYYEIRLYGRYNYVTANPNIPGIPASNENPPPGYDVTGILGYNFHPTQAVNLTPFIRINVAYNMGPVYSDTNGDYVNSTTYAYLIGGKLAVQASPTLSPYATIWGGYQVNNLTGAFPNSATMSNTQITGVLNQIAVYYELGLGIRLSEHLTVVPYWQYITTFNSPNGPAATAIDQGGLNQSYLTGTSQVLAIKLTVSW